jgi:tight adherence protein B
VPLRVGEYLLLRLLTASGAGLLLSVLGGSTLATVPGAIIGYFVPKFYVVHKSKTRISSLNLQLVEALSLSANSLRAGWGFMQAMSQIATEMPPPISEEFTQVLQEVSIGSTNEAAIQSLITRVPSYDLELVMTAVLIQRQIGGNLAEMMDNIAFTIRERTRLIADIASITSESTMSMWVLSLLPIGLLVFMAVTQAEYLGAFMTDPRGRMMLVGAGVMEVAGVLVMRRMADVKV